MGTREFTQNQCCGGKLFIHLLHIHILFNAHCTPDMVLVLIFEKHQLFSHSNLVAKFGFYFQHNNNTSSSHLPQSIEKAIIGLKEQCESTQVTIDFRCVVPPLVFSFHSPCDIRQDIVVGTRVIYRNRRDVSIENTATANLFFTFSEH